MPPRMLPKHTIAEKNMLKLTLANKFTELTVTNNKSKYTWLKASTREEPLASQLDGRSKSDTAASIAAAELLCERAREIGRKQITFERGRLQYAGKVKAIVDTLAENGIEFVKHAKSRGEFEPTPWPSSKKTSHSDVVRRIALSMTAPAPEAA